jgi:hypothetical protein
MENGQNLGQTDFEFLKHAAEKHVYYEAAGLETNVTNKRRVQRMKSNHAGRIRPLLDETVIQTLGPR